MKKVLSILFLSVFLLTIASIVNAKKERTVLLSKTGRGNLEYFYWDSVKYKGKIADFSTKLLFKDPESELLKQGVAYIITDASIYCDTREIAYKRISKYDKNNKLIDTFNYPENRNKIPEGTILNTKYKLICNK